jgi:hypothetical protein
MRIIASKIVGPKFRETFQEKAPPPNGKSACLPKNIPYFS